MSMSDHSQKITILETGESPHLNITKALQIILHRKEKSFIVKYSNQ